MFAKSLLCGIATEALLALLYLATGGIGPCGPVNNFAYVIGMPLMVFHLPGFYIVEFLNLPGGAVYISLCALYAMLWTGAWYLWFARKAK